MAMKSLTDLYIHFLRDVLYAEKQGMKTVRRMSRRAENDDLKTLFTEQADDTEAQIENIEKAFELIDKSARGVRCEAMDGIIEESKDLMEEAQDGAVRDAAMIAAAQAMKHYEITRYGTLAAWARQLGHEDAAKLMKDNADRDIAADKALSKLAEKHLNQQADTLAA
ncbi:ferritin-like domain-containing protein [Acuticoccus sp.]|uniref:YciE/YciF ferroxidase family protein n=1 Tax=Acuticoccus sp. TaxID=1904378 RepID=UPI003B52269A